MTPSLGTGGRDLTRRTPSRPLTPWTELLTLSWKERLLVAAGGFTFALLFFAIPWVVLVVAGGPQQ